MDSLTQIVLGAAVGAAVGGRKYGKKSALIGAICGTIPDLDALLFIGADPVTSFTYHRGFSHSLLFAIFATPVFAWIFSKIKWFKTDFKDKEIHLIVFLGLLTHMLLDGLTIYGTQLLWPSHYPPLGAGSVFIIDPLYTFPLLIGVLFFLFRKSIRSVNVALIITTAYLAWGAIAQNHVNNIFEASYQDDYDHYLVQTTPFNSFLWRVLVIKEEGYEVGYYSVFDQTKEITFKFFESKPQLIKPIKESFAVDRLYWFTKGFHSVSKVHNNIIMTDLRMGLEPDNYVFGFIVGKEEGGKIIPTENKRYSQMRNMGELKIIWRRIWDESVEL